MSPPKRSCCVQGLELLLAFKGCEETCSCICTDITSRRNVAMTLFYDVFEHRGTRTHFKYIKNSSFFISLKAKVL